MLDYMQAIQGCGMEVDFIPGGYTGAVQVLDEGVNKPSKQFVQQEYELWMVANQDGVKPVRLDIARWVFNSWEWVTVEMIRNTWNLIGLQNCVDMGIVGLVAGEGHYKTGLPSTWDVVGSPLYKFTISMYILNLLVTTMF